MDANIAAQADCRVTADQRAEQNCDVDRVANLRRKTCMTNSIPLEITQGVALRRQEVYPGFALARSGLRFARPKELLKAPDQCQSGDHRTKLPESPLRHRSASKCQTEVCVTGLALH